MTMLCVLALTGCAFSFENVYYVYHVPQADGSVGEITVKRKADYGPNGERETPVFTTSIIIDGEEYLPGSQIYDHFISMVYLPEYDHRNAQSMPTLFPSMGDPETSVRPASIF